MKRNTIAALILLILTAVLLEPTAAQPSAAAANLIACPWFRYEFPPQPPFAALCGEWTRDNNNGIIQEDGIPSPDSLDGIAYQATRKYNHSDESKLWQIVESPGGLRLHFSVFHQIPAQGDLIVRIYGRDTRYGIGGWVLLWTPVDEQGGNNVWQYVEKELTLQRPYRFYMVEIVSHVPLPLGTTGAAFTGVYLSVDGGAVYLPIISEGSQ